MDRSRTSDEARVLVIYTGGTIGMLVGKHGYVPEPYFLTETLRSQTRFHDPLQESLFSHSGSVQGFRQWNSGRSSPQPMESPHTPPDDDFGITIPVRSSRPIGHSLALDPALSRAVLQAQPKSIRVTENVYEALLPTLVTPRSKVPGDSTSKCIRYAILEWNPLLDSSNMNIEDWVRIATEIELNYSTFDAFVILHGTDTMAYTSSALSYLLEDLGKTVIITGAQIPLSQLRNDANDNLMGALTIAGHYIIPECCLYFNHTLYRGNRVTKMSSYDLSAFASPNFSPLVNVGIDIVVNWSDVIRQTSVRKFKAHKEMSPHVATLRLFPGITGATIKAFFMPPIQGVVLETFGAGNAPQRPDILEALKEACARGVVVVAISQCAKGSVSAAYETGQTLLQAGVVAGSDMTPEAALTKLSYLLSKKELSTQKVRELIGIPLRGELTKPTAAAVQSTTIEDNVEGIQQLLTQFVRLAQPATTHPNPPPPLIRLDSADSSTSTTTLGNGNDHGIVPDTAAPWSWTAAEAVSTQAVLLPFLIHLAAARNDIESLQFCLKTAGENQDEPGGAGPQLIESMRTRMIPGGIVNCVDPGSGRAPLHVASLHGHLPAVELLLRSGALVHLRDALGHTPLYLAARQGHEQVVEVLVEAGARLGGLDLPFADAVIKAAALAGDKDALRIWLQAGWQTNVTTHPN